MFFDQEFICNSVIWIIKIIFLFSVFPQIVLNYKLKTARGLSDLFILGSLAGQTSYIGYAFYANLPLVYKIMNPIYSASLLFLAIQRLYYTNVVDRKKILFFYISIFSVMSFLMVLAFNGNSFAGSFLGWFPMGTGFFKKLPQIFKIYLQKTIKGFSFGFILLNITAYIFEMFAAIFLNLPLQVIANDLKNIFLFSIFLFQFFLYSKCSD